LRNIRVDRGRKKGENGLEELKMRVKESSSMIIGLYSFRVMIEEVAFEYKESKKELERSWFQQKRLKKSVIVLGDILFFRDHFRKLYPDTPLPDTKPHTSATVVRDRLGVHFANKFLFQAKLAVNAVKKKWPLEGTEEAWQRLGLHSMNTLVEEIAPIYDMHPDILTKNVEKESNEFKKWKERLIEKKAGRKRKKQTNSPKIQNIRNSKRKPRAPTEAVMVVISKRHCNFSPGFQGSGRI